MWKPVGMDSGIAFILIFSGSIFTAGPEVMKEEFSLVVVALSPFEVCIVIVGLVTSI